MKEIKVSAMVPDKDNGQDLDFHHFPVITMEEMAERVKADWPGTFKTIQDQCAEWRAKESEISKAKGRDKQGEDGSLTKTRRTFALSSYEWMLLGVMVDLKEELDKIIKCRCGCERPALKTSKTNCVSGHRPDPKRYRFIDGVWWKLDE